MTKKNIAKFLLFSQSALFLAGSFVAWTATTQRFIAFYDIEGTIFKFRDCAFTNPLLTSCFYGGVAFVVAFFWSLFILMAKDGEKQNLQQKKLLWLILACVLFAWSNYSYELYNYVKAAGDPVMGCSGVITHPLKTACFYGSAIFLASFINALALLKFSSFAPHQQLKNGE